MTVRFRAEAVADVSLAREWYEARSPGLGDAFVDSLEAIIGLVVDLPEAFPEIAVGLRRALLSRTTSPPGTCSWSRRRLHR